MILTLIWSFIFGALYTKNNKSDGPSLNVRNVEWFFLYETSVPQSLYVIAAQNTTTPKMWELGTIHWLYGVRWYGITIKNLQDVRKTFSQLHIKEMLPRQSDNGFNITGNWYSISPYTAQSVNNTRFSYLWSGGILCSHDVWTLLYTRFVEEESLNISDI